MAAGTTCRSPRECVVVPVSVCERERKKLLEVAVDGQRWQQEPRVDRLKNVWLCVCVCVCVCVRVSAPSVSPSVYVCVRVRV